VPAAACVVFGHAARVTRQERSVLELALLLPCAQAPLPYPADSRESGARNAERAGRLLRNDTLPGMSGSAERALLPTRRS
jgi:hypothetical protein